MLETFLWYVLPNIALFGSLWLIAKGIERFMWFLIQNYDDIMSGKLTLRKNRK
jgi:hypothetical protein